MVITDDSTTILPIFGRAVLRADLLLRGLTDLGETPMPGGCCPTGAWLMQSLTLRYWEPETEKAKNAARAPEEEGQEGTQEEWSQDVEWYGDEWMDDESSYDWIGSLDDWSGAWSWSEDDWSYWSDDWYSRRCDCPAGPGSECAKVFQDYLALIDPTGMKAKEGYKWDMWEINEHELKLIRHVRMWRHEMLDPRIRLANKSPVPITGQWSRLAGARVTYKTYKDGSTVTVRDANFMTLSNARSTDPKQWRGRVEFGLKHKPQLRHVQKTAPRPFDPMNGRDESEVVNEDIVEFPKSNDPSVAIDKLGNEPEVFDRQTDCGGNAEQQTDDKSAVKPKMLKVPGEPSGSERRLHELTHLPYRDWCNHCVRSKGRQSHAVKKNDRQLVIQIDFSFLSTENDLPKRTILNATDVQTGYSMAVVLPAKGSVEKYAVAELRRFVFEICARLLVDCRYVQHRLNTLRVKGVLEMCRGASQWFSEVYLGKDTEAEEENEEQLEDMVVGKYGTKIDVDVNAEEGELDQEMRLAEPLLWESEFPPEAEKKGMIKEMNSMKEFDVYDEVMVKDCAEEQVSEALDCRWVKVWKNETDLRCREVVRGCLQNFEKTEEDNLFASTPSLVTMRLLLCMALARNWGITLGDVSTAFLHAAMSGEVFVWPPKEFYPNGDCLWKLKKAMYGLRQAPNVAGTFR
ncbi:Copia protein [Symbiodinium microadriaticum]|uniref:Copia protein n=1 Tax=Symbiodinium microadriaticum TaxID=2951 RepID=A0A1Q9CHN9_SYMMI|nr:Copia protein [Symbiodinium microadriaticum]